MTEQTWQGKAFAPVFYRAMAEWHEGGEVGPDPKANWEFTSLGSCWLSNGIAAYPGFVSDVAYRWKKSSGVNHD